MMNEGSFSSYYLTQAALEQLQFLKEENK